MGRLFLVDFEERETPATQYFVCRACQTHIVLFEGRLHYDEDRGFQPFFNVVNTFDGNANLSPFDVLVESSFCVKCKDQLGFRETSSGIQEHFEQKSMSLLYLEKLLVMKNGNYEYPEYGEPIQDA